MARPKSWGHSGAGDAAKNTLLLSDHVLRNLEGKNAPARVIEFHYELEDVDPEEVAREYGCRFLGRFEFKL